MATVRQKIQQDIDAAQKSLDEAIEQQTKQIAKAQKALDDAKDKMTIFQKWLDFQMEEVRDAVITLFRSL